MLIILLQIICNFIGIIVEAVVVVMLMVVVVLITVVKVITLTLVNSLRAADGIDTFYVHGCSR